MTGGHLLAPPSSQIETPKTKKRLEHRQQPIPPASPYGRGAWPWGAWPCRPWDLPGRSARERMPPSRISSMSCRLRRMYWACCLGVRIAKRRPSRSFMRIRCGPASFGTPRRAPCSARPSWQGHRAAGGVLHEDPEVGLVARALLVDGLEDFHSFEGLGIAHGERLAHPLNHIEAHHVSAYPLEEAGGPGLVLGVPEPLWQSTGARMTRPLATLFA